MAGRGPTPKDPETRARRNKTAGAGMRVIQTRKAEQPKLPVLYDHVTDAEGKTKRVRFVWPAVTKRWWQMWADSPLSADYTANDWSELLDTALIHARYWKGDTKLAGELRLRTAKFGATPEDRARLRIMFVDAAEAEARAPQQSPTGSSSRERRGPLRAV